jgi:uncharacterized protein GlcG (DUF336 family)
MLRSKKNVLASICVFASILAVPVWGQQELAQPTMGSQDSAAPPDGLPGDVRPPSVDIQLRVPLGSPAGTHAPTPAKEVAKSSLPLGLALEAAQAAMQSCLTDGYSLAVAVIDTTGNIRVGLSADDSTPAGRTYVAVRKGLAAMLFKAPTSTLRTKFAADPSLRAQLKPNMAVLPGALPIMVGDRVVGAIGVSGATGNEEEKCAGDGVAKIQSRLK